MSTAEPQEFRWYCLIGRLSDPDRGGTVQFVHFVQATSWRNAVKYYGGRQRCVDHTGRDREVMFPTRKNEVIPMPLNWTPNDIQSGTIPGLSVVVKVIPAVRYVCSHCGKVRLSERRYPYVWCNCSHRAYPSSDAAVTSAAAELMVDNAGQRE